MATPLNRVQQAIAAGAGQGNITLGAAASDSFTMAEAGAINGEAYGYVIEEGSDFEIGYGVYSSAGPTMTRNVDASKIGGNAGTAKMNLGAGARFKCTLRKSEFDQVAIPVKTGGRLQEILGNASLSDCNNGLSTGVFGVNNTAANSPAAVWGMMQVFVWDTSQIVQTFHEFVSIGSRQRQWTRIRANGTWGGWQEDSDRIGSGRLAAACKSITNWNDVSENGYYMAADAANAPVGGWLIGHAVAHNNLWVSQEVQDFTNLRRKWKRHKNNGGWAGWVQTEGNDGHTWHHYNFDPNSRINNVRFVSVMDHVVDTVYQQITIEDGGWVVTSVSRYDQNGTVRMRRRALQCTWDGGNWYTVGFQ